MNKRKHNQLKSEVIYSQALLSAYKYQEPFCVNIRYRFLMPVTLKRQPTTVVSPNAAQCRASCQYLFIGQKAARN